MEAQLEMIQKKDDVAKLKAEWQQKGEETPQELTQEQQDSEAQKVDSYKIQAITTMLDDFENIIAKNFCQFADYEDFSFA